jgi:hypothetical protein
MCAWKYIWILKFGFAKKILKFGNFVKKDHLPDW